MQLASIMSPGTPAKTKNTVYQTAKKKAEVYSAPPVVEKPVRVTPIIDKPTPSQPPPKPLVVQVEKPEPEQQQKDTQTNIAKKPAAGRIKLPGTFSIKDDEQEQAVAAEPQEEYFDFGSEEFRSAKAVDSNGLETAWREMIKKLTVGHSNLSSTLSGSKPRIGDHFELEFDVKNKVQEKEIDAIKNDIVPLLRKMLNNRFIRLKVIANPDVEEVRPFSDIEIFRHMAEKNPAIVSLKEKFGLEPE
jgi:DNA polymerase-3 subunit gamma/tau